MAITKVVTQTNTSISVTLSGYSTLEAGSTFSFVLYNIKNNVPIQRSFRVYTDCTSYTLTFDGLDPGQQYGAYIELKTESGNQYRYPSGGDGWYHPSDGFYTTGTDPFDMSGVSGYAYGYGTYISVSLSGIPRASSPRTFTMMIKPTSGGSWTEANSTTVSSSYSSTAYLSAFNLNEQTSYDIQIIASYTLAEQYSPMTEVVETFYGVNTGYDSDCGLSISSVTEKGCTLSAYAAASATYPRTIRWYGKEGAGGVWELLTETVATSSMTQTHSRNDLKPSTYYEFKIEVSVGGTFVGTDSATCTTSAPAGTLTASDATEYSAKLTLSGLATGISYKREIEWYYKASSDSDYTKYPTVSNVVASASSASMVIDLLASSTAYSFKAVILCDGVSIGTKTATISTKETVASISVDSVTSASVKIAVKDLVNVAYTRTFEWLYKRQGDVDYVQFDETSMLPSDTSGEITKVFKPLSAATYFDFKVHIKKDKVVMKVLTLTARTALDNSLVPDTEIEKIEQAIGEKTVKVYWDAPAHELGTYYKVQYSTDDENFVDIGDVMTQPPSSGYTSITLPSLDEEYYVQIMSYFEIDGEIASKFSESRSVYTFSVISWDTPKTKSQPFSITASEWNRVVNVVKERLECEDVMMDEYIFDLAVPGKDVTAVQFNQVLDAISVFNPHAIARVSVGDAITADMLNTLIAKVNLE